METITHAVQSASNALWNEVDALRGGQQTQAEQRVPQQQEQHGDEPMSGIQGKGTVTDPYDAGNRDDQLGAPISKDNTAAMTGPLSSTAPGTFQGKYQDSNSNKDDKAALVTSNIGPSNPSFEHPDPVVGKQHTSGPAGKSTLKDEPLSTHKSTLKDEGLASRPKPDEPAATDNTRSTAAATTAEKVNAAGPSAGLGSGIAAGAGAGSLSGSAAAAAAQPPSEQRGNISFSHAQSVSQPNDNKPSTSAAGTAKSVSQSKSKEPSATDLSAPQAPRQVTENSSGPTTAGTGAAPTNVSKDERKEPSTAGTGAGADAETTESGSAEKLVPSTEEVAEKHGVSKEALRGPSVPPPRESYERQMQGAESQKKKDDQPKTSKNDDKMEKHHSSMKEKLNKVLHHHH
ncbi:hypothetical protein BDW60DRAFT_191000 [Aspergillus nidulans var. acristatus]